MGPAESLYADCAGEVYPFGAFVYRFSDNQPDCVLPISKLALLKETNDKSVFQTDAASIEAEQYWAQIFALLIIGTSKEDMEHEKQLDFEVLLEIQLFSILVNSAAFVLCIALGHICAQEMP